MCALKSVLESLEFLYLLIWKYYVVFLISQKLIRDYGLEISLIKHFFNSLYFQILFLFMHLDCPENTPNHTHSFDEAKVIQYF